MKKSLLLLFVGIAASFCMNAQTLTLSDSHGDPIANGARVDIPVDQLITYIHVTNTSGAAVNARAKKVHVNISEGDEVSLCWGGQCYPHSAMTVPPLDRSPVTIDAGATDESFDITYFTGTTGVPSEFTVVFYYEEDPNDSSYIYINWKPESVSEMKRTEAYTTAYPNPASNYVNIDVEMETTENAEVVFFNVLGKEIYKQEIIDNKETIQLNTANWTNGVYYYTLFNNSRKITTQKLIINH